MKRKLAGLLLLTILYTLLNTGCAPQMHVASPPPRPTPPEPSSHK